MPTTSILKPGSVIAGCVVEDILGIGGMGVVYRARPLLGGTVAVKLMHRELVSKPELVRRFRDEARACQLLDHPNLVHVVEAGDTEDGTPFIVMDYVPGRPLGIAIEEAGSMSLHRTSAIIGQLLAALGHAHVRSVVHADVKTDNILLGDEDRVTLIDFGLARLTNEPTRASRNDFVLSGTPEYMAPEVIRGAEPTPRSDLYGAGVIFYEMLTGTTPFGGGEPGVILGRHLDEVVVPPSLRCPNREIPISLERVVLRALEKDPAARYASADAFARALLAATPAEEPDEPRVVEDSQHVTAELPTLNWQLAQLPDEVRDSRAADHLRSTEQAARRAVEAAMSRTDVAGVATASLDLARVLVGSRRTLEATSELELAIEWSSSKPDASGALWSMLLTLAALYDRLGDPQCALRAAFAGRAHAVLAGSPIGCAFADTLLDRMNVRPIVPTTVGSVRAG
jgi:serine/threonine protein kinase